MMKPVRVLVVFLLGILVILPFTVTAERNDTVEVSLVFPEKTQTVRTEQGTVRGVLLDQGVSANDFAHVFPSPESNIVDGLKIFLYRSNADHNSDREPKTRSEAPKPRTVYSSALPEGKQLIVRGRQRSSKPEKRFLPRVVLKGGPNYKAEKLKELVEKGSMAMLATGYSPHAPSTAPYNDGYSAVGLPAGYGLVAVDPDVIPLGTRLYVEGYGYAIAADVGGGINGRQIDLCFNTHMNAMRFGRQWVKVHILG